MRYGVLFLISFITFKPICSQPFSKVDSVNGNYKIYTGIIESSKLEGGSCAYRLVVSKDCNYIEISSVYWRTISVQYRLEKISNFQTFSIAKTMSQEMDTTAFYYVAIDSSMVNEIKKGERGFRDLKSRNFFTDLRELDILIFSLFLKIIIQHNLQSEYLKYKPESFVAWLKVRRGNITN